ncbi:MAG TPA: HPr family phosphocarrier protein [Thermoanaerobaculia bacterium]|nr:HPr family phosphocarrier protein [Thermoanaerobaculia bacterium]
MIERELAIRNRLGLHARAAAKFVQTASRFKSAVKVRKNGEEVDGKSILGILLLAASQGTRIIVCVSGEDETDALAAVEDLVARSFDEGE